jgi:small subunit ribosomal protein S21
MTQIILEDSDRVEWALKAFRRKVQRAGILKEVRQKRYYVKPSVAKRLKSAAARRKRARRDRER